MFWILHRFVINWLYIAALTQVLQAVWGAIVSLHKDWAQEHKPLVLTVFIVLGSIGVSATLIQSGRSAATNARLEDALSNLSQSTSQIQREAELNTKLQESLLKQNGTIADLAHRGIDNVTGRNSFSYLDRFELEGSQHIPVVIHRGAYPLYNLIARLVDIGKPYSPKSLSAALLGDLTLQIGDLAPRTAWIDTRVSVPFSGDDKQDFNIFFRAKNGSWVEQIRLRKISGVWMRALKITDEDATRIRLLCIDEKYPRVLDGVIADWKGVPDPSCTGH